MARRPSWRLAAVVLVALIGVSAVATLLRDDDGPQEEDIPQLFLDAWRRSREATFRTVAEFSRRSNSTDSVLRHEQITVQRPPDRLFVDGDGANGLIDGQRVACTFRNERLRCNEAEAQVTLAEETDRQLETLAGYVQGEDPLYVIEADLETEAGACFELTLTKPIVAPPLGNLARYCFDDATGAPTVTHIERIEADDDIVTRQISDVVTDEDLDPATVLG
ncbi:MAG TPA: hypothetical protein VD926_10635 [Acidimicrobiales bacterium]|nr:hypothetical protein [Acidimicrobiales bacterium]